MRYWDASALVALIVVEPDSAPRAKPLREDPQVVTWWGSAIECASALNGRARAGELDPGGLRLALKRLDVLAAAWVEILPGDRVRRRAIRLLRVHPLCAADALQLSACLTASGDAPEALPFACADARLRDAADKEGCPVMA